MSREHLLQLDQRLRALGVEASDLVERFTSARGPGGQHVNRTASAVQLHHRPTGIDIRAEGARSQLRNRIAAREQLIARLESARAEAEARRIAVLERQRRKQRRPSPAARARNVARKRVKGSTKRLRGRVRDTDDS